jgi:hypothetical protein
MEWEWVVPLIGVGISGLLFIFKPLIQYYKKRRQLLSIKYGQGVFATWNYSQEEWRIAAQNQFDLAVRMGDNGKVSFTPRFIYASNGRRDLLWELIGEVKYERHLTDIFLYHESPMNVIKFEVRTKKVKKDSHGNDRMEESCGLKDFYVPVPKDYHQEIEKVMSFYQKILHDNSDAVAAVMPFGLGLFGK